MAYTIYIAICALAGATMATTACDFKSWQFWVILSCVVGAQICGRCLGGL